MPIFPPWIRAAEPAQYYGQGYGLGLREWEQQAQDARAWNEMAMQGEAQAARQAQAEQELGLREAEFGLSQEELGMRQAVEQRKAQEASQLYAARQEYQRRVQSGEDPIQVLMEMGPMMGSQQTAEAAAIRAMMQGQKQAPSQIMGIPLIDPATGKPIPGLMGAPTTGGGVTFHPQPGYAAAQTANRPPTLGALVNRERLMRQYQADISKIITEMPEVTEQAPPAAWNTRRKAEWKARRDAIDQIKAAMQRIPGAATNAPATPTLIYNERTGKLEPIGPTTSDEEDENGGALPAEPVPTEAGDTVGY